jgi:hypothetical protein
MSVKTIGRVFFISLAKLVLSQSNETEQEAYNVTCFNVHISLNKYKVMKSATSVTFKMSKLGLPCTIVMAQPITNLSLITNVPHACVASH